MSDPTVTLLDMTVTASQISDSPLQVKVIVTREFIVEGATPDQAIFEATS